MAQKNVRAVAASILSKLLSGNGSLSSHLRNFSDHQEQSLLQELCFGSSRWFHKLDFLLNKLLEKPLKQKDQDLRCLLVVGLYQLHELSIPQHAVLNETVGASVELKKPWAKGLINGVLRNFLRKESELVKALKQAPSNVQNSFPDWLNSKITTAWPETSSEILANSNLRPPMILRINRTKTSRDEYLALLEQNNLAAKAGALASTAVYLSAPSPVNEIPGFNAGLVSIQDEASQLATEQLALEPGLRVLDACAAPGGKTCHIAESEHLLTNLTAVEMHPQRSSRILENLSRLSLDCEVKCADICELDKWWDGQPFERILVDAPCSATGVIRRHPDIKLLRTPAEVQRLVKLQQEILYKLWTCLAPNGLLLYTTCSVLPEENSELIQQFLESTDNAKFEGITADWGVECRYGRQLLTGASDAPDGFFYSLLRKT